MTPSPVFRDTKNTQLQTGKVRRERRERNEGQENALIWSKSISGESRRRSGNKTSISVKHALTEYKS